MNSKIRLNSNVVDFENTQITFRIQDKGKIVAFFCPVTKIISFDHICQRFADVNFVSVLPTSFSLVAFLFLFGHSRRHIMTRHNVHEREKLN